MLREAVVERPKAPGFYGLAEALDNRVKETCRNDLLLKDVEDHVLALRDRQGGTLEALDAFVEREHAFLIAVKTLGYLFGKV